MTFITIEQFGASPSEADNGPMIQAALDAAAGAPVYAGPGVFSVVTPIVYDTTGDGEVEGAKLIGSGKKKTVFDNKTGGPLLALTSGASFLDFQNDICLEQFGIINSTGNANCSGVKLTGIRFGTVSLGIYDQGQHGIWLTSTVNDASDCMNIDFVNGDYQRNGGWGIHIDADQLGVHANLKVNNNRCIQNAAGGIYAATVTTSEFRRNVLAYNGGPGLRVLKRPGGSYSKNVIVELNEFDSQNDQCIISGCVDATVSHNYVIANAGVSTPMQRGFVLDNCINVTLDKNYPRIGPNLTGVTLFYVSASCSAVKIRHTEYSSWLSAGNTKHTILNSGTEIV